MIVTKYTTCCIRFSLLRIHPQPNIDLDKPVNAKVKQN